MQIAIGIVTALAVFVTWLGHLSARALLRRRPAARGATPPVTVFKPLKGVEDELLENLCSFAEQDYPGMQLLFGVADLDDPALEVARRVRDQYPEVDVEVVAGAEEFGLNPKVTNLASMARHAKHELWLISDSNVRAQPDYVASTVAELTQPGVKLVTHLFGGMRGQSLGARFENLHLNSCVPSGMGMAKVLTRTPCVVGKSMAFRRSDLERAGGLEGVRDVLAEDYLIGLRFVELGFEVVVAPHAVQSVNRSWSLRRFLSRHQRWGQLRWRLSPVIYVLEPLLNPVLLALLLALAGQPALAAAAVAAKVLSDALLARRLLGHWPRLRDLAWIPAKDLLIAGVWLVAWLGREVHWRGRRLVVGRGTVLQDPARPRRAARPAPVLHGRP